MKAFFSQHQSKHAPELELQNGELVPHAESQARVDAIRGVLKDVETPTNYGLEPILDVHEAG